MVPADELMVEIYPNPAAGNLTLNLKKPLSAAATLLLSDYTGRTIKSMLVSAGQQRLTVPLDNVAPGTYLIQLHTANSTMYAKFIRQ